jgi:hypothetical protein
VCSDVQTFQYKTGGRLKYQFSEKMAIANCDAFGNSKILAQIDDCYHDNLVVSLAWFLLGAL